ncbi:MAG: glycosyltransferase family 9 protein [Cyclobacteriaceae bacterium]|nr:glycosyltransferase family 9 protein [Cyclobacteriaceae bacterium]
MIEVKKILIIRFSSISDIAWTSPVIRCVKKQIPGVALHFATEMRYKSMVEANPYIDKIHYLEESLGDLIKELGQERFDFIIDLHNNFRTTLIKLRLGVRSGTYDKLRWQRFLFTNFQIDFMPNCHVVDRYFEAASPLGIVNDNEGLDYFIPEKDEVEPEWLPESFRKGLCGLCDRR